MQVTIYGWDEADFRCVPCLKAKRLAETKGLDYSFVPLAKNNPNQIHVAHRAELDAKLANLDKELKTLPVVFVDDSYIGGFTDFRSYIHKIVENTWNS